jgi:co-chaperonin GroES (HSP10)
LQEEIKIGDYVFFGKHSGHEVVLNGKVFRQLELQEVTATGSAEDLLSPP